MNDILAECPPLARLLFAGLWTIADREGRLEDRPKKIKTQILPYDVCDIDSLLNDLNTAGFITRYEASGSAYIQISNFTKHQLPHYKELPSVIPAPEFHKDSLYVGGGVKDSVRKTILERDKKCKKCGSEKNLTIDHIKARSFGGTNEESNLQTLCGSCNSSKNNKLDNEQSIIDLSSMDDRSNKTLADSLNPSSFLLNPSPKAPLPPPELSTGPQGKGASAADAAIATRRYSIVHKLSDAAHERAKLLCKSLNRDFYHLCRVYDDGVTSGARPPPDSPDVAFPAWISAYSKNQRL
jgi:hypothetical protein